MARFHWQILARTRGCFSRDREINPPAIIVIRLQRFWRHFRRYPKMKMRSGSKRTVVFLFLCLPFSSTALQLTKVCVYRPHSHRSFICLFSAFLSSYSNELNQFHRFHLVLLIGSLIHYFLGFLSSCCKIINLAFILMFYAGFQRIGTWKVIYRLHCGIRDWNLNYLLCRNIVWLYVSATYGYLNLIWYLNMKLRNLKQVEEDVHEVHCSRERSRAAWNIIDEVMEIGRAKWANFIDIMIWFSWFHNTLSRMLFGI